MRRRGGQELTGEMEIAWGDTLMPAALRDSTEGDMLTPVAEASTAPRLVLNRQGLLEKSEAPAWTCK